MRLFKQNEYFYRVKFFLTELNFFKGDINIYFEYITLFETKKKKSFAEKNKIFAKMIHSFFLKIYIFFRIVLLHLNNHSHKSNNNVTYPIDHAVTSVHVTNKLHYIFILWNLLPLNLRG